MEGPRGYDREYRKPLPGSLQIRIGYSSQKGTITRFITQLEYWLDGEWCQVVRYDHDPAAPDEIAHDVRTEGLHVDVYREGAKERTRRVPGRSPKRGLQSGRSAFAQAPPRDNRALRTMARDTEPMTEEELAAAREGIREAFAEARADIGLDLDEEDAVPDGGED